MADNTPKPGGKLPRQLARKLFKTTRQALQEREALADVSDEELKTRIDEIQTRLNEEKPSNQALSTVAALTSIAAERTLGQKMHPNQILTGVAIANGCVSELATGEGKTLAATIPAVWWALDEKGVHIATANDYLAKRDALWMGKVYQALGLTASWVEPALTTKEKQAAYQCDVTYGTATELGFDYLRDHLVVTKEEAVQRERWAMIVDEADALLIDEAKTPLIISGKPKTSPDQWHQYSEFAKQLSGDCVDVDKGEHVAILNEQGIDKAEEQFQVENLYLEPTLAHHLNAAVIAQTLYEKDRDYIVDNDTVLLVDEHTGRTMDDRRLQDSIHEALEAKEGVTVHSGAVTVATISLQAFFGGYTRLGGMSGTAESDHEELETTYGVPVAVIPTHKPVVRKDQTDIVYASEKDKLGAIVEKIQERHEAGQPILVGTPTVEDSEIISAKLDEVGVNHQVLNARRNTNEAIIVAQAGRLGAVTVATNMAGRGVDIKLGGNPEALAGKEMNLEKTPQELLAEGLEDQEAMDEKTLDQFNQTLEKWQETCELERDAVLACGGLYVLGCTRHSSRRIDDQLRGRSGRQGEPGESRFYLSLDDPLIQDFASGTALALLNRIAPEEGEPLESKMFAKIIETAQNAQEQYHESIRDTLRHYDGVNSVLRDRFYELREDLLDMNHQDLLETWFSHAGACVLEEVCSDWREPADVDKDLLTEAVADMLPNGVPDSLYVAPTVDDAVDILVESSLDDLEKRWEHAPEAARDETIRKILLDMADSAYQTTLEDLESLRSGIHLRGLGGRDPQVEYLKEANARFDWMFDEMFIRGAKRLMELYVEKVEFKNEDGEVVETVDLLNPDKQVQLDKPKKLF